MGIYITTVIDTGRAPVGPAGGPVRAGAKGAAVAYGLEEGAAELAQCEVRRLHIIAGQNERWPVTVTAAAVAGITYSAAVTCTGWQLLIIALLAAARRVAIVHPAGHIALAAAAGQAVPLPLSAVTLL